MRSSELKQKWGFLFVLAAAPFLCSIGHAQSASKLNLHTGEEIFQAACAGCHGADGKGQPEHVLGFEKPSSFPDFTDCKGTTPEADLQWSAIIHNGGVARGESRIMPSFGDRENPALTDEEIGKVVRYLRSFCSGDKKWPSGVYNLPLTMFTEKAFPEDEVVLLNHVSLTGASTYDNDLIFEKRYGATSNLTLHFRGNFFKPDNGHWSGRIGDTSIEYKKAMWMLDRTKTLVTLGGELTIPTGDPKTGGNGVTQTEAYVAIAQLLPKNAYLQEQLGGEGPPWHRHQNPMSVFTRTAIGKTFITDHGLGRLISIANEFVATREFERKQAWTMDVVPQVQFTLSKLQHVRLGVGVSVPAVNVQDRGKQLMFYLLWDTADGKWYRGWK